MCGVYSSEWWDYFCIDDPVAELGEGACHFGNGWYAYNGYYLAALDLICCDGETVEGSVCPPPCAPSERTLDGWCGNTYNPADCCSEMCGVYSSEWWDYFCIDDPVAELGEGACDWSGGWYAYNGFSLDGFVCCNGTKVRGTECPRLDHAPADKR
jgi:hypothetical protein